VTGNLAIYSIDLVTCRLFFDTVFTACRCRVDRKLASIEFFLAHVTLAIRTCFDATQSTLNFLELPLSQPGAFLGFFC